LELIVSLARTRRSFLDFVLQSFRTSIHREKVSMALFLDGEMHTVLASYDA
jgi:hypothetical protein